MRILGLSELGRRAQKVVREEPRCADLLGIEAGGELHLYHLVIPAQAEAWQSYYSLWAKVAPSGAGYDHYRLAHLALSGEWQQLDVEGSFEYCMRQMMENRYHLFFG